MRAPIALRFPPDCWHFVQTMCASSTAVPLAADIRAILSGASRIEVRMPIPEPRFIVNVTRTQAETLQHWLHALLDGLSHEDDRRLTCLQCISRVAGALRLSES